MGVAVHGDDSRGRSRDWAAAANRLGTQAPHDARPTQWVESLWSSAEQDEVDLPWDRTEPYPVVAEAVAALGPAARRRAVVVGAALGADAEWLAAQGWRTTAFDVSPAAVRLARERYPDSAVDYRVGDLLDLTDDLVGAFDLVVEVFTVQAMPWTVRDVATRAVGRLLAPGGTAVVVQHTRGDADPHVGPPWLLDRAEMEAFGTGDAGADLRLVSLEERSGVDADRVGHAVWVGVLSRASA